MKKREKIEEIHQSLVNGQRRQAIKLVKKYGHYDFWADYAEFLKSWYAEPGAWFEFFSDMTITYFRMRGR